MPDDRPPSGDAAIFAVFEVFAGAFAVVGTERLFSGAYTTAAIAYLIAVFLAITGLKWRYFANKIGPRFTSYIEKIGKDPRYWISILLLLALAGGIKGVLYVHTLRHDLDTYVMPRSLTEKQQENLREYLSHHQAYAVTVKVQPRDEEALNYAGQIFNALRQSKWDVTMSTSDKPPYTLNNGLCIHEQGMNERPYDPNDPNNPVALLQQAFRAANIQVNCGGGAAAGPYALFVLVGHRPLRIGDQTPILQKIGRWIMTLGQ